MLIHQRFKELRKYLKMTQTEFGEQLGKTMRTIQEYERANRAITDGVLLNLQEKFNVNIDWMRTGKGNMFVDEAKEPNKYQWLINTLDKLPEEEVKRIEKEAQKLLEKQNNKEMNVNHSKNVG